MIESPYLTPINRTSVADEIVERLTGLILNAGLKPGDKLPPERELMARLSVGRSSLREAIKTLSAVGALDVRDREGTFVGSGGACILNKPLYWHLLLGERSIREVTETRHMVEVEMAGLAAKRATQEEIGAIAERMEEMRVSLDEADSSYSARDLEFHLAVASASHNRLMYQVLDTLKNVVRAWIGKNILDVEGRPISFCEHIPILEAIREHRPEEARQAMADHLDRAAIRVIVGLNESNHNGEA